MRFVKSDSLSKGMKLAKPIYNKNGVLLYDRGTKLTKQGINSIKNFKLYGIYVLEPVEPVPPMTEDDIEFERFQTMNVYGIRDTWELLIMGKNLISLENMAREIQKRYVSNEKKVDFSQTLRSEEDEVYKHALNVAILSALMAARLKISETEQLNLIKAALLYDIGQAGNELKKSDFTDEEEYYAQAGLRGSKIINGSDFVSDSVKDIVLSDYRLMAGIKTLEESPLSVKILRAAQTYDTLTAMRLGEEPMTDVSAIKSLLAESKKYGVEVIAALIDSIKILYPGICVEMTDGSAGVVIKSNRENVLRPIILLFGSNRVVDLGEDKEFEKHQITDIMKNLDKRVVIDPKIIEEYMERYSA